MYFVSMMSSLDFTSRASVCLFNSSSHESQAAVNSFAVLKKWVDKIVILFEFAFLPREEAVSVSAPGHTLSVVISSS